FKVGIKFVLSWDIPGNWAFEVIMSLVLKDISHDFDPGGAIGSCKFYPQMSMRYLDPPKGSQKRTGKRPKVVALHGTISILTNNVIPTTLAGSLDPDLQSMASGVQAISMFYDTNISDDA